MGTIFSEFGCPQRPRRQVLLSVGLQGVLQRLAGDLDAVRRWDEQLSVGEQQRLSVARLLVQRPSYALVDEALGDGSQEVTL